MKHDDDIFKFGRDRGGAQSFQRLHRDIARTIGITIVSGEVGPGNILSGEIASSTEFNVSRAAYREAIRTLASKGMVESRPKIGTRVTQRNQWNLIDPDVLEWFFSTEQPDENFVKSLFELRMIVEPAAAALAAMRRTDAHLEQLYHAWSNMDKNTLATDAGRLADREFHHTILEASGNEVLCTLSTGIGAAVLWTTILKYKERDLPRDPVKDHYLVYEAIRDADSMAAEEAMRKLVGLALSDIREMTESG